MYRYINPSDDSFLNDETYQRVREQMDLFISNLKSEEDKQLMVRMISNCYHKYHDSIKIKSGNYTEPMLSIIMALSMEQNIEIES